MMTFIEMVKAVRASIGYTQAQFAEGLGISAQYLCDIESGRRKPSVALVNRICAYMGRGPLGIAEWHRAGAVANGWLLSASQIANPIQPDHRQ